MVPEVGANPGARSITETGKDSGCGLRRSWAAELGHGPQRSPMTLADRSLRDETMQPSSVGPPQSEVRRVVPGKRVCRAGKMRGCHHDFPVLRRQEWSARVRG